MTGVHNISEQVLDTKVERALNLGISYVPRPHPLAITDYQDSLNNMARSLHLGVGQNESG
jgi:hypothetical protein